MSDLLGGEAEALFAALGEPPAVGLRVNTLKLSPAELQALLPWRLEPLPWTETGFVVQGDAAPGKHPFHAAGLYYLQDPSAMAVAEAALPQPGESILDLAAAPGGKSTHLAALMRDRGLLVANEVNRGRGGALLENLERWGVQNALFMNEDVSRLAERWDASFDKVLLDAPCSGEGMFRKSEEALFHWSEANIQACAARQHGLLGDAARLVKPLGKLVYSTCTFAPEENEGVVADFLQDHPDFRLEPLSLPGSSPGLEGFGPDLGGSARLWPQRAPGEGHFIAKLTREAGPATPFKPAKLPAAPGRAAALWKTFATSTLAHDPVIGKRLAVFGDKLYALPDDLPDLSGLRSLRAGLWLGVLHKDRLEPSHSLALALARNEALQARHLALEPDDPRALHYLQGHILEEPGEDGWLVVTVAGFPLGWGKRSQSVVKNLYPKGLRWP